MPYNAIQCHTEPSKSHDPKQSESGTVEMPYVMQSMESSRLPARAHEHRTPTLPFLKPGVQRSFCITEPRPRGSSQVEMDDGECGMSQRVLRKAGRSFAAETGVCREATRCASHLTLLTLWMALREVSELLVMRFLPVVGAGAFLSSMAKQNESTLCGCIWLHMVACKD